MRKRAYQSWTGLLERYDKLMEYKYSTVVAWVVGFSILAVLPHVVQGTYMGVTPSRWLTVNVLVLTLVWATAAQAWNIMSGFTGQFSFGHAAFFGVGAYVTQLLLIEQSINPWIGMMIGAFVAMIYGVLIGALIFRYNLRGHYFALATLAFAELSRHVFRNFDTLGGSYGLYRPLAREYADGPGYIAFQFTSNVPYYYIILVFLFVVSLVAYMLKNSVVGLQFFAIKDDQDAAKSIGIPVFRYKLAAFGISAFFTAWVGAFWSMYFRSIRPETVFDILINVEVLLPAIVGGIGTVAGPIIGSFIVTPLAQIARRTIGLHGMDSIIYGFLLVLFVLYAPKGVISWPSQFKNLLAPGDQENKTESE